jgi:hypothetical protein
VLQGDFASEWDHPHPDTQSRVIFDGKWDCPQCRPFNQAREGKRLREGLRAHRDNLWLSVFPSAGREAAVAAATSQGLAYVALPITGDETALLTVGPLVGHSEKVTDLDGLAEALMRCRWTQHHLAASRGLLPPTREYHLWEAYHRGTGRRCWHLHPTREKARECAQATGASVDGTAKGWYLRGVSPRRSLGRVGVTAEHLRWLLNDQKIKHWAETTPPTGDADDTPEEHRTLIRFEAMDWDDPRFRNLRDMARWKPPRGASENWEPPPFRFTLRVTRRGDLLA